MRVLFSIFILLPICGFPQLEVSLYFPEPEKLVKLGINKMKEENLWLYYDKGDTTIREDCIVQFWFNENGQKFLRKKFGWNDSITIYENEIFKYDSIGNFIESIESRPWKRIDSSEVTSIQITYDKDGQIIIENRINSYKDQMDSIRTKTVLVYKWYKNGNVIRDSTISTYRYHGTAYIRCREYIYENNLIKTEILKIDSVNNRYKYYHYQNNRLVKITLNAPGKKEKIAEEYFYDEFGNLIKKITQWSKERIATYEYNESNKIIAYNPDLNSKIPRHYEFYYNEKGLASKVLTFAPKDNWIHVLKLEYYK